MMDYSNMTKIPLISKIGLVLLAYCFSSKATRRTASMIDGVSIDKKTAAMVWNVVNAGSIKRETPFRCTFDDIIRVGHTNGNIREIFIMGSDGSSVKIKPPVPLTLYIRSEILYHELMHKRDKAKKEKEALREMISEKIIEKSGL